MDIQAHQFVKFFDSERSAKLCQLATVETFPDDAIIFEEGEIPDFLYLVLEGEILFRKQITGNNFQIVAQAVPNDFFGEFGILDGQPRSAQAIVRGRAVLAKIPRNIVIEILNNTNGEVVLKLFHYVIQRLRTTTEQYVKQLAYKEKMVLVGEMVNTIIHDLKSPLSGIQLSSGMVREMYPDDEETVEWCNLIQAQATRMAAMAEELLEFARGSAVLRKRPIKILETLKHFEKLNRIYFQDERVDFSITCPEDLIVEFDDMKLMRVIQNIAINSVQAFDSNGGNVDLLVRKFSDRIRIEIRDNGPGIPESIRENFFEAFVTYGKQGGTGLGTAIAKSIIDAHHGQIYFETSHETGTTFFVELPFSATSD
ncbi:HAMP domain-containing sensor histidine kinase [Spirulina sp. 06S082]|uniref:HAMP domain-containing sensor histidine kinase n=1 Tax=Spirulina sp. 06S082 TaxID=3110248 RepID=UPI002B1ED66E|nr:HAMP domain-containing sensor histidine kinase [Spirulina sp. 06S082]MEA5470897.1 HAMP domain-containing sensor histidine kinase [Spirulina sp. 06S082]